MEAKIKIGCLLIAAIMLACSAQAAVVAVAQGASGQATITSGTINNTVIGGTTPVAGSFTTVIGTSLTSGSALVVPTGGIGLIKITADGAAPGAGGCKFEAVCGTNAGSAKLIMYCGTSTTPVTVTDNIGSGVTGC